MANAERSDITALLIRWKNGNSDALEELVPLVYPRLKEIAGAFIRRERSQHTLSATALVHELYLRLLGGQKPDLSDRVHFYSFAAHMMRRILIDHARAHHAEKRGGDSVHLPLDTDLAWINRNSPLEMIDLDRALAELEAIDPRKVRLVELRHFLGCTGEKAAEALNISKATADRDIKFAKSWLYLRLRGAGPELPTPAAR
jgi:RNA polymerase sigma factor (TIGR02999 family)